MTRPFPALWRPTEWRGQTGKEGILALSLVPSWEEVLQLLGLGYAGFRRCIDWSA